MIVVGNALSNVLGSDETLKDGNEGGAVRGVIDGFSVGAADLKRGRVEGELLGFELESTPGTIEGSEDGSLLLSDIGRLGDALEFVLDNALGDKLGNVIGSDDISKDGNDDGVERGIMDGLSVGAVEPNEGSIEGELLGLELVSILSTMDGSEEGSLLLSVISRLGDELGDALGNVLGSDDTRKDKDGNDDGAV